MALPAPTLFRLKFEPKKGLTLRSLAEHELGLDKTNDEVDRWGFLPSSYAMEMARLRTRA